MKNILIAKRFCTKAVKQSLDVPQNISRYFSLTKPTTSMEKLFPKKFTKPEFEKYYSGAQIMNHTNISQVLVDSSNHGINIPCWDMLDRGGKKWRMVLGLMIAKYINVDIENIKDNEMLYKLVAFTELLHNASLIIDDVEDKSTERRNDLCVHLKFGNFIIIY